MSTYNGWTNYATWRVMLEYFDGFDTDERMTADACREMMEDAIDSTTDAGIARDLANAFIAQVNWQEIADAVNANNELDDDDNNDDNTDEESDE